MSKLAERNHSSEEIGSVIPINISQRYIQTNSPSNGQLYSSDQSHRLIVSQKPFSNTHSKCSPYAKPSPNRHIQQQIAGLASSQCNETGLHNTINNNNSILQDFQYSTIKNNSLTQTKQFSNPQFGNNSYSLHRSTTIGYDNPNFQNNEMNKSQAHKNITNTINSDISKSKSKYKERSFENCKSNRDGFEKINRISSNLNSAVNVEEQLSKERDKQHINHILPHAKLRRDNHLTVASIAKFTHKSHPKHLWKEVLPPLLPDDVVRNSRLYASNSSNMSIQKNISTQTEDEFTLTKINDPEKNSTHVSKICCWETEKENLAQLRYENEVKNNTRVSSPVQRSEITRKRSTIENVGDVLEVSERERALDEWVPSTCLIPNRLRLEHRSECLNDLHAVDEDTELSCGSEDSSSGHDEVDLEVSKQLKVGDDVSTGYEETCSEFGYLCMNSKHSKSSDGNILSHHDSNGNNILNDMYYLTYGSEIEENEDYQTKYQKLLKQSVPLSRHATSDILGNNKETQFEYLRKSSTPVAMLSSQEKMNNLQTRMAMKIKLQTRNSPPSRGNPSRYNDATSSDTDRQQITNSTSNNRLESYELKGKNSIDNNMPKGVIRKMIQQFEHNFTRQDNNSILPEENKIEEEKTENNVNEGRKRLYVKNTRNSKIYKRSKYDSLSKKSISSENISTNSSLYHITNNRINSNLSKSFDNVFNVRRNNFADMSSHNNTGPHITEETNSRYFKDSNTIATIPTSARNNNNPFLFHPKVGNESSKLSQETSYSGEMLESSIGSREQLLDTMVNDTNLLERNTSSNVWQHRAESDRQGTDSSTLPAPGNKCLVILENDAANWLNQDEGRNDEGRCERSLPIASRRRHDVFDGNTNAISKGIKSVSGSRGFDGERNIGNSWSKEANEAKNKAGIRHTSNKENRCVGFDDTEVIIGDNLQITKL